MNRSAPPIARRTTTSRVVATGLAVAVAMLIGAVPTLAGDAVPGTPDLVADINVGGSSDPRELTAVGSTVYFSAVGPGGRELWKSDGTQLGTVRVKNINPGPAGSDPKELTNVGGILYFSALGTGGRELWKSDGTALGTVRVRDIKPGTGSSRPQDLTRYGHLLLFVADDGSHGRELWRSDGTRAGTRLVIDTNPNQGSSARELVAAHGLVFFVADPFGSPQGHGADILWKTNGTEAGTKSLGGSFCGPWALTRVGVLLYFNTGNCKAPLSELWRTDGTNPGTKRVAGSNGDALTNVGGTLYLASYEGDALWKSDGTAATTVKVKDMEVWGIGEAGDLAFVRADDAGSGLWVSDGSALGTTRLVDENCPTEMTDVGGTLYFAGGAYDSGTEECDVELWKSDGSTTGTVQVHDLDPVGASQPTELTNVAGTLYFAADDGTHGRELWRLIP